MRFRFPPCTLTGLVAPAVVVRMVSTVSRAMVSLPLVMAIFLNSVFVGHLANVRPSVAGGVETTDQNRCLLFCFGHVCVEHKSMLRRLILRRPLAPIRLEPLWNLLENENKLDVCVLS